MADVLIQHPARALTSEQIHQLAEMPAETAIRQTVSFRLML
jgi:hypothetical protein